MFSFAGLVTEHNTEERERENTQALKINTAAAAEHNPDTSLNTA